MNRFLCPTCSMDFQPAQSPLCSRCGTVFTAFEGEDHLCENCIRAPRHFHQARAAGIYEGALRRVIQDFKFHGRIHLARPLGLLMLHTFHDMYAQNVRLLPALSFPFLFMTEGTGCADLIRHFFWPII